MQVLVHQTDADHVQTIKVWQIRFAANGLIGQLDGDRCAFADGAGHVDFALHQRQQTGGDGHAQTGAADLGTGRFFALHKRIAEGIHQILIHPDPIVGHHDLQAGGVPFLHRGHRADKNTHLAGPVCQPAGGVFDRIADHVQQDLPHTAAIQVDPDRHIKIDKQALAHPVG